MGSWRAALRRGEARGRVFLRSAWAVGEMLFSGKPRLGADDGWLILPRLDGIGDFWLWLPFVHTLQKTFPERRTHLIANALWTELARDTTLFDRITPLYPHKLLRDPAYRRKVWTAIREAPSGILLNTTPRRRIAVEDSIAWFYPASHRVGVAPADAYDALESSYLREWLDKRLYTDIIPPSTALHEWSRYDEYARAMHMPKLDLGIYENVRNRLKAISSCTSETDYLVVLPGASVPYKTIPHTLMKRLLEEVYARTRLPLFILGGKGESPQAHLLRQYLPGVPMKDLTGRLSLTQALMYIEGSVGVIGVDTGLVHVAVSWGKPTLVLMGGGHWGRFFPYPPGFPHQPFILHHFMPCYGCGWFCQYTLSRDKPYPCMTALAQASLQPFYQWLSAISARKTE